MKSRLLSRKVTIAVVVLTLALVAAACVPTPSREPTRFTPQTLLKYPEKAPDAARDDGNPSRCDSSNPNASIQKVGLYLAFWFQPTQTQFYNCRKIAGTNSYSTHAAHRAADMFFNANDTAQRNRANAMVMTLLATDEGGHPHALARRMGIQRIIWNRQIWSAPFFQTRAYTGQHPHTDHVHIEITNAAKAGHTSFFGSWNVLGAKPGCQAGAWCLAWVPVGNYAL